MTTCSGWVRTLKGRNVTFTGLVYLGGDRFSHRECGELVESHGGSWSDDLSNETDLVIKGWQRSVDYEGTRASRKLVLARQSNAEQSDRSHVHIVRAVGFAHLLGNHRAECVNRPLEGHSGDWVRAVTADGQRERIEGRLDIVLHDSGDYVLPTVVLRRKRYEVFPESVHVIESGSPPLKSKKLIFGGGLQDAAVDDLLRSYWQDWAPRYDITWEEMFAQLEVLVDPLKAAGWKETGSGRERGGWEEDDFVFATLVRNDISVELELGEAGWVSGWEDLLLEEHVDEDAERTELSNPRIIPGIGNTRDQLGIVRRYRRERWLP
jgi:hypothetical protein